MTTALSHRGPDADGFFFDGVCGLGHRRLSIIDLSAAANQPMFTSDERYAMVYNGEVYNFKELRKQLDIELRTSSDSEVILELFAKFNIRSVYQLNGIFAYAIYDQFEKSLYLFRDRVGIKPLYYYYDEENFAFASEIKSLLTLPQIQKNLNRSAVADFLHLGYVPAPQSIYQNIHKMPAGSWLKISPNGLVQDQYWSLSEKVYDQATQKKLGILNREAEAKQQLKKTLLSAVNYQLVSDVPLGVFLSGGIDSSLVTALATQEADNQINTFSIGFKENKFNEADYAQAVAKHLRTNHHEFMVSTAEAKAWIPQLIDIYDEPFADSSAIPTLLVSKLARQHVTVALGGDGGDELFFGYGMYQWAERLAKPFWQTVRKPVAGTLRMFRGNKYQKARSLFNYSKKQDLASHIFSQEQHLFSKKEISNLLINPGLPSKYGFLPVKRNLNAMEAQALFDLQYYLQDDLLVKVDRASMRFALEARVPLLDHRVIEFAINLAPELKYKNKTSKYLLKQVLYDYVPAKLFDRPKQGFAIPLVDWLKTDLKYLIDDYLNENMVKHYGLVKYEAVDSMKKYFLKGNSYYYNRLWALIVLHQFMAKNF
ncbi:MAG: asparagine synthase (glutamine-hydrolyzing) [Microscillaceae bacterium]|nr:asparagine synthase (glutamine-hydrolyzing) [Microscillaceae bacterium]